MNKRAKRGLVYAEVIIGIAITGILMLALAAFTTAVSTGWKHIAQEFKARNADVRSAGQMQDALRNMLCIVQAKIGDSSGANAYFFCWQTDSYGGTADGKAQFGEMALIEYEPATKAIWIYTVKDVSTMTAAEKISASSESWGDYTSPSIVTYFKSNSIVGPRKPLVGGYSTTGDSGVSVAGARFGVFSPNNGKPIASYVLMIGDTISSAPAFGSVSLRSALKPSNL